MHFCKVCNCRLRRSAAALCIVLSFCVSVASCRSRKYKLPVDNLQISCADGRTVRVDAELATKSEERAYGFMNRKDIPDGTGMLFVFDHDQILSFWMKNTPHPLSIAYIDSQGIIRDVFDMTPFSENSIKSTRSVRFALEVPQGWFAKENISVGDKVLLSDGQKLRSLSADPIK